MIRTIPEDKYKSKDIGGSISATGYKSETYIYGSGFGKPQS